MGLESAKNRAGVEFKKGDHVVFSCGDWRGAQTQRFEITSFDVRETRSFGRKVGESVTVYGTCPNGVAWGGCSIEEIRKTAAGAPGVRS